MSTRKLIYLGIVLVAFSIITLGCTQEQRSVEIGLEWNESAGKIENKIEQVPVNTMVYVYYDNVTPIEETNLNLHMINEDKEGEILAGSSIVVEPQDTTGVLRLDVAQEGQYILKIFTAKEELFTKKIEVVGKK